MSDITYGKMLCKRFHLKIPYSFIYTSLNVKKPIRCIPLSYTYLSNSHRGYYGGPNGGTIMSGLHSEESEHTLRTTNYNRYIRKIFFNSRKIWPIQQFVILKLWFLS